MKAALHFLFLLLLNTVAWAHPRLSLIENDEIIRVSLDEKPVLEYLKKEKPVPAGMKKAYRRSGYLHPVFSPGGQEVSGDFPEDHPHQHGLFFAWTRAKFDDKQVDFWNLAKETGRVEFRRVEGKEIGEKHLSFSVKHAFVARKGHERRDVIHENWTVTVHETTGDHFLFDLSSEQECVAGKPLILPKYKYGGMAFRGNAQWLITKEGGKTVNFLTSEGKDRVKGNHSRPNWVAMTGKIDEQDTTIIVMGHSKNFRAPQPVRLHPEKPYFCFAPMVAGEFKIEPGKKYLSRYRYLVTSSKPDLKMIEKAWQDYASEAR
ncbi:MAG: PmoA family protein [Akkermansiaceae bacterium]